jgi:3'-phosphoadenosine 5'-phosphosulfate sulfotransferase (PAPS reductase)/FAD synthetase
MTGGLAATKYIVGVSGGIDSQAALNWALDEFGVDSVIAMNADPGGNEHPLTTEHIQWLSENVHPIITVRATLRDCYERDETIARHSDRLGINPDDPISFATLAAIKGRFPSPRAQFCTEFLKLRPMLAWMELHKEEIGEYERITGLRRDESDKRVTTPDREWDDFFGCYVRHPLAHWTKRQCFHLCLTKSQKINALYRLGFSRVGCAPCVNASRDDIRGWAKRFPEMIDKVRDWEREVGRTFFRPMVPGKEINWIDEVVAWSNCTRGGKQFSLEMWMPAPVCESKFGLCE